MQTYLHKFYRYVGSKISGNEYERINISICRKHYIIVALFSFPVSFLHSLSAHCGARASTIVQTYSTPEYRHVREDMGLGEFPISHGIKVGDVMFRYPC